MTIPRWQLAILTDELSRVEARRLSAAITAASSPHLKPAARRELVRKVGRSVELRSPAPSEIPKVGHDPAAAAAWFASKGIRVESA